MSKLKIIWISWALPFPINYGGAIRTYYLLKALSKTHSVTLLCFGQSKSIPNELREICSDVYIFPYDYDKRIAQLIAFIKRQCSFKFMFSSSAMDSWISKNAQKYQIVILDRTNVGWVNIPQYLPKIFNLQNIESEVMVRMSKDDPNLIRKYFRAIDGKRLERDEKELLRTANLIFTTSDREKMILRSWGLNMPIETIPNGVDIQRFSAKSDERSENTKITDIFFIGSMNYYPNEQGLLFFIREVWPIISSKRPNTRLSIFVGNTNRQISKYKDHNIDFIPDNNSDRVSLFKASKLFIAPIMSGGGTHIKILEAIAAGVPIVATSIGCEGLPFRDKEHCLIADDPRSFASACLDVLNNPIAASDRAKKAYELVKQLFNWDDIGNKMTKLIESVVQH